MRDRGIRVLLGALASAVLLSTACKLPEAGTENEGQANEAQNLDTFGKEGKAPEQPATGGSGLQPDNPSGIGAPGYSTPREDPNQTDSAQDEPAENRGPASVNQPYPPAEGRPGSPTQQSSDEDEK